MRKLQVSPFLALLIWLLALAPASAASFPPPIVPDNFGVNIHFTGAPPKDIEGIARMGVHWIRMDFWWAGIEKTRGVYDFSAYDTLYAALTAHGIHPIFILDYENPLYSPNSPSTPETRAAFARFAAAAASHFVGKTILWELWNEPNIGFWKPTPNVADYAAFAIETAQAIKASDPNATVIAPGMSTMDFAFAESCFQAGLLKYIDAVSFHPYRPTNPETAASDYATLRGLIARYAPSGKDIPLVSSEWGYTTADVSEQTQAQYLTREWLSNLEQGIKVSIWYDWHDDGTDPKNGEHNFGTVNNDYSPKPAFTAASTLIHTLSGYRFIKRVVTPSDTDYLLIFAKGHSYKLAAWTTGNDHTISIPFTGTATLTHMLGDTEHLTAHAGSLNLPISQSPVYVTVPAGNTEIALAASWTVAPTYGVSKDYSAHFSIQFTNPLDRTLYVSFAAASPGAADGTYTVEVSLARRVAPTKTVTLPMDLEEMQAQLQLVLQKSLSPSRNLHDVAFQPFEESVNFAPLNPISLIMAPIRSGGFGYVIENPSGEPFTGELDEIWDKRTVESLISVRSGEHHKLITVRLGGGPPSEKFTVQLENSDGRAILQLPPIGFAPLPGEPSGWKVAADGDPKVMSKFDISAAPSGPLLNAPAAMLSYTFAQGWSFVRVFDPSAQPLPGKPTGETIWVDGDNSGDALRMRFADSTGQTFQQDFGKCDWTGWRPVSCQFDGSNHWGGANDGVIHYPIKIDSLLLLDSTAQNYTPSSLLICDPEMVY